jgi:hypothetical protein
MLIALFIALQLPWVQCCSVGGRVTPPTEGHPYSADWRVTHNGETSDVVAVGLDATIPLPCGESVIEATVNYRHEFLIFKDGFEEGAADWNKPSPPYDYRVTSQPIQCEGGPHA